MIDIKGGAWCESVEECAARAYAKDCYLGSSNPECLTQHDYFPGVVYNTTMGGCTGRLRRVPGPQHRSTFQCGCALCVYVRTIVRVVSQTRIFFRPVTALGGVEGA